MKMITIEMTRQQALEQGLLVCTCGHPVNNHWLNYPAKNNSCARCSCKQYNEIASVGKLIEKRRMSVQQAIVKMKSKGWSVHPQLAADSAMWYPPVGSKSHRGIPRTGLSFREACSFEAVSYTTKP
jgi:hypothetical protein